MSPVIRAAVFDLDGTVLYTLDSIALAGNRMLKALGLPEQPVDDYRYFCGDGSDTLVERCLRAAGGYTEENLRKGRILNPKFLAEQPLYGVKPYDGIPEALAALKERGIRLAVFSNKPDGPAQSVIRGCFGDLFDIVRGQVPGTPVKPDPAGALAILAELRVSPEESLYFGDTWTDMRTGRAAGMRTVGVLWGYRDEKELAENGADRIISSPGEIPLCFGDEIREQAAEFPDDHSEGGQS